MTRPMTVDLDGSASNAERRQLADQLAALGLDPNRVPIRSTLRFDPANSEVIATYHRIPNRIDWSTGQIATIQIRRRVVLEDVITTINRMFGTKLSPARPRLTSRPPRATNGPRRRSKVIQGGRSNLSHQVVPRACPVGRLMTEVDFTATREADGTVWIDRAPELIHVTPELVDQLRANGDLDGYGRWYVGTADRGAGAALYQLNGETAQGGRMVVMVRRSLMTPDDALGGPEPRWQHLDTRETNGGTVVYHWRLDYPEKVCEISREIVASHRDRCANHAGHLKPCQVWTRTPPECDHRHLDPEADPAAPHCLACGATGEDVTDQLDQEGRP